LTHQRIFIFLAQGLIAPCLIRFAFQVRYFRLAFAFYAANLLNVGLMMAILLPNVFKYFFGKVKKIFAGVAVTKKKRQQL
ncbi:hypothetical protein ACQWF0_25630, partial [Salmonella enterica subsp. enterica serovar Infantis]